MNRHALLPASHNRITHPKRIFLFATCILIAALLAIHGRNTSAARASAEPPTPDATNEVVERWYGTVYIENTWEDAYASCPWTCPGNEQEVMFEEWSLDVMEDGSVSGTIRTEIVSYSYEQTETNNSCGPTAETNYTIDNCQFSWRMTQPQSTITLQGKRELNRLGEPVLTITSQSETQDCEMQWKARGTHSTTGQTVDKEENHKCSSPILVPQTLKIVTYEDGRAPIIPLNRFFSCCGNTQIEVGHLIAGLDDPMLDLDRELLDRSVFLDQVPVEELFTAKMDWNSPDGGYVTWELEGQESERVGPIEVEELPKPVDNGSQGVGRKKLTVQAKSTLKKISEPEVTEVQVAPPPGWTGGPGEISATKVSGAVTYKSTVKFPEPPFDGEITVWKRVPFLGGKSFGIRKTQGSFSWEAQSTSEGQGSLTGQTGLKIMGKEIVGSITGRAKVILDQMGVKIPEGGIDFGIAGTVESDPEPLLQVVPSLRPALIVIERISSSAAAFINERATLKLEVSPKFDFGFTFFTENDEFKFKNAEVKPGIGFKTVLEIKLIEKVLQATASIGGAIAATFQVPEPYFKEAAFQGVVTAQLIFYKWAWEGERAWSVVISGASAAASNVNDLLAQTFTEGSWQLIDQTPLTQPNYALWHGDSTAAIASTQAASAIDDRLLVENVLPLAQPSMHAWTNSSGTTRVFQTWSQDDPADENPFSAGEIRMSLYTGSWQSPSDLFNDAQDDLAPLPIYLTNNQRLVVWQRVDTPTPPDFDDDPEGYLSHMQIYAQRVGGTMVQLSPGGSLNYRHQLGVISDGALAVWVNNPANQMIGDTTNPDHILFARYANASSNWPVTGTVVSNVAGLLDLDLATNGTHATLIYSLDTDNVLTTTADLELFYTVWNGASWNAPTQFTNNSVPDESPQLELAPDGSARLVWRQAGTLKFLNGTWATPPTDLPLPGAAERTDYELVQSTDGHLALVWQEAGPEDTRVAYAIFDATHNRWSGEMTLPIPEGYEGSMATSIAAVLLPADDEDEEDNGTLLVSYQLAHIEVITETFNDVETVSGQVDGVPIANVAKIVQRDLRSAAIPLRINLSVAPSDLSIPAADRIQAVIHNTGELAAENVPVALFVGPPDPVTGIVPRVDQTIPLLAAGSATTLTFTVADPTISYLAVEIDPDRTLNESDRSDNLALLGADIGVSPLPTFYGPLGATIRAQVQQNGHRYVSLLAPATLTLESPNGPVVGGGQVGFPLAATESVTLSAYLSPTALGPGRHFLFWNVDPEGTLGETDRSNNIAGTSVLVLPDLVGVQDSIYYAAAPGSSARFSMTVQNMGNWISSNATLKVFDGPASAATSHLLLELTIPAIEPGGAIELSGLLQLSGLPSASTGLKAIFIELDSERVIEESNENNNSLAAGSVLEAAEVSNAPLFLPKIQR
jgi:hypothetical protein